MLQPLRPKLLKKAGAVKPASVALLPYRNLRLRERLHESVLGQPAAIEIVADFIELYYAGFTAEDRPIGNVMLLGTTGTGKTYLAEMLAQILHGDKTKLMKIDCAEFQEPHEIAKLIGAPPGYLGHGKTSARLTQKNLNEFTSAKCDISIILFDEIEKADETLFQLLLGILDKGSITLGDTNTTDFSKSLILFSSNFAMSNIVRRSTSAHGFLQNHKLEVTASDRKTVKSGLVKVFSPEFVNRLDDIIFFEPLSPDTLIDIIGLEIKKEQAFFVEKRVYLPLSPKIVKYLISLTIDAKFGAREVKRLLYREIRLPVAKLINDITILTYPLAIATSLSRDGKLTFAVETHAVIS